MMLIGVAGGTGSGKTTVVNKITEGVPEDCIVKVSQDAYYKNNSHLTEEERHAYNFDHPDSIDWQLLEIHLKELLQGNTIEMPKYSFLTSTRLPETVQLKAKMVIIVEGILVLTKASIRNLCNLKVFVDAPSDERLIRVIQRDIQERDRNIEEVLKRYLETVKPMHQQFIEPSKQHADIIIPQGGSNKVAIDLLITAVLEKTKQYGETY